MKERRSTENEQRAAATGNLAAAAQQLVVGELERLGRQIESEFRELDQSARVNVTYAAPGDERAWYWRGQIVYTANRVDFFVDLQDGTWWTAMRASALGQSLRYLVVVQKVGHGNLGILNVTTFAEVLDDSADKPDDRREFRRAFEPTAKDSVTMVHTNRAEDHWLEIAELIDRTLSTALKYFVDQLS